MEQQNVRTWPLPFGEQPELEFKADALAVSVLPVGEGAEPRMEILGRETSDMSVQVRHNGSKVRVDVEWRPIWRWFGGWDARAVLHVPPALRAKIRTSAGSIDARDLGPCDLELKTDAGRITAANLSGKLRLETDAGQIKADGLSGTIKARTDAGAIQLGIADLAPGDHEIHTEVGAIRVELAPGRDVAVETRTSIGAMQNDYRSSANAQAHLRITTSVGSIKVRETSVSPIATPAADTPVPATDAAPAPEPVAASVAAAADSSAAPTVPAARDEGEVVRILKMVESGELSAREADELLQALGRG